MKEQKGSEKWQHTEWNSDPKSAGMSTPPEARREHASANTTAVGREDRGTAIEAGTTGQERSRQAGTRGSHAARCRHGLPARQGPQLHGQHRPYHLASFSPRNQTLWLPAGLTASPTVPVTTGPVFQHRLVLPALTICLLTLGAPHTQQWINPAALRWLLRKVTGGRGGPRERERVAGGPDEAVPPHLSLGPSQS